MQDAMLGSIIGLEIHISVSLIVNFPIGDRLDLSCGGSRGKGRDFRAGGG